MMQWHHWQWHLRPMVAVAIVMVVPNCAAAVDAATTIPSLALMAAAKTPLPPPPATAASIDDECYCCRWQPPLPLPISQWWMVVVVLVDRDSNGKGRHSWFLVAKMCYEWGYVFQGVHLRMSGEVLRCLGSDTSIHNRTSPRSYNQRHLLLHFFLVNWYIHWSCFEP